MFTDCPPPPHATHRSSLLEGAAAEASATIAFVQIRNGLKGLREGRLVDPLAFARHCEANLQILERCLATHIAAGVAPGIHDLLETGAPDPRQLGLFEGPRQ